MWRRLCCAGLMAMLGGVAHADDVFLKGGARISGRLLSRTATSVEVDVGAGTVTIPMSSVDRIEERRTPLDEYYERAASLGAADGAGWLRLATWATSQGLGTQSRIAFGNVLNVDPSNADANQALRRVLLDGRWVSEEDSYRARGYVRFEGEWITPAEQNAILEQRAAAYAPEVASLDAERRVLEAEARASAAESRARSAEANAPWTAGHPVALGSWGSSGSWGYTNPRGGGRPPRATSVTPQSPLPSMYPSQPLFTPLSPLVPPPSVWTPPPSAAWCRLARTASRRATQPPLDFTRHHDDVSRRSPAMARLRRGVYSRAWWGRTSKG